MIGLVLAWVAAISALVYPGCTMKHIQTRSIDTKGNPVELSADITYFLMDQKTSGFTATAPGLDIKFGKQESSARTEILLEVLKAYNAGM